MNWKKDQWKVNKKVLGTFSCNILKGERKHIGQPVMVGSTFNRKTEMPLASIMECHNLDSFLATVSKEKKYIGVSGQKMWDT